MSLAYTWERLFAGVLTLAGGPAGIRERLADAYMSQIIRLRPQNRTSAHPGPEDRYDLAKRCDSLLERIAKSDYGAGTTTALVLGARYYKRIGAHVLNILSSIVMPVHKLDYFDEDEIPEADLRGCAGWRRMNPRRRDSVAV